MQKTKNDEKHLGADAAEVDGRMATSADPSAIARHTPGPWLVRECSHGGMILIRGEQMGAKHHPQSMLQIIPTEDAHLIAAAPDYWQATEQLAKDAGELDGDDAGYVAVPKDAFDALMAAHRKAEGR